ncbi:MAG: UvrD-helicase domain-containing protein, partial [Clostridia bacterium]|nr:UvrD-helicase domain-containing protein [Clostridia bacterium]
QRISAAISDALAKNGENEFLARQISLLPSAKFSTIDSFYLSLVRENYAALGLSPSFRIADTGEAELIERETMERLIDDCYDNPESKICGGPDGFANLVDILVGGGSDRGLCDTLLSLYKTVSSYPKGALALNEAAATIREYASLDFFDCPYGQRIKEHLENMISYFKTAYIAAMSAMETHAELAVTYYITFSEDFPKILNAEKTLNEGYIEGRAAIMDIDFPKIKTYRGEKNDFVLRVKRIRDDFKKAIKDTKAKYLFANFSEIRANMLTSAGVCAALGDLLAEYEKKLEAEKKRRNLCTFSDLSRYSLRLLVDEYGNDTPFAHEQKKLYDAIYIDEYQDVNAVQNRIFEAISTPRNRFMVGDIKQSIYSFRGAEPSIFSYLRHCYPDINNSEGSENATIFMSHNFRCNKEIIDFTNEVCNYLMPLISPDMHYSEEDALIYGKENKSDQKIPVTVAVVEKPPKGSDDEGKNTEAAFIADKIYELIHGGTKDDGSPITPDDIAILMRSPKTKADTFAAALNARGIPVYAATDENLLLKNEVEIVRNFISALDNPRRDISLAGALLSPLCHVDATYLASIRNSRSDCRLITTVRTHTSDNDENGHKLKAFVEKLESFRKMARFMNAGELIDAIYADMSIPSVLGGKSILRRANLEKFRQIAYAYSSSTGASLSSFLRYLRSIENSGTVITAAKAGEETRGAVRIMSVHKSKGLEFPVVFYANTHTPYNLSDKNASPLYTNAAGFGMRLRDESGFCSYDTMLRKSVALSKERADKEEELRMLYVALTRARERLFVTAMHSSPDKLFVDASFERACSSPYLALSKRCHLELILLALGSDNGDCYGYEIIPYKKLEATAEESHSKAIGISECIGETEELLAKRFSYVYPHMARTKIPAKFSISRLYPDIIDDEVLEISVGERPLPKAEIAPKFIRSEDSLGAKKGTATHLFMQFFDFDNAVKNGAEAELCRLVEKRFITEDDAKLVNLDEVKVFLSSKIFDRMRNAKKIFREQRFNLYLPAAEFTADNELKEELKEERILVQGVIDCFFYDDDGEIVLVDYKTDRVPKDKKAAEYKLKSAYSEQLGYYARAIEEICGKPPKSKLIFSLALGEAILI